MTHNAHREQDSGADRKAREKQDPCEKQGPDENQARRTSPSRTGMVLARLDANLPLRLLGFGLIYAWSTCLWEIPFMGDGSPSTLQGGDGWLLSAALTPLTCLAIALAGRTRTLVDRRWITVAAPLLCSVGTVAVLGAESTVGTTRLLCVIAAGIGTGCGPALLVLLWTALFSKLDMGIIETVVPASFVATLLCTLVIPALAPAVSMPLLVALPLLSGLLFALSRHSFQEGHIAPAEKESAEAVGPVSLHAFARMLILVVIVYILACLSAAVVAVPLSPTDEAFTTMAGMLFAIALSISIVLFARRVNITALYRWITVPFVVAMVAAPLPFVEAAALSRVLMNVVFTGIEIIIVLYVVKLAQVTQRPAAFFIGWGEWAGYFGVLLGYVLLEPFAVQLATSDESLFACLVILGAFCLASLLVPQDERALTATRAQTAVAETAGRNALLDDSVADGRAAIANSESAPAPVAFSYGAEMDAILAHRTAVAQRFGLSARETEIFLLLAQGRSRPYIRDSLYLSKNTVATHIRHIYEKLSVHSQQELIDLVEE
ncbi:LuxR C-terminal-related transcriptional regulator [Adlercreutzia equolifaciens]|uniref:LuxR C-terminal-related transcriptional regulator n=1 Tax=Adlercreutzia equolifaciens TaxID=446660 RepID=UPI0023B0188F|nr:LuxR C-terminal-related transcriptional regulator [Adlercreutzia equolifaciens]MDE8701880.1 LuxR C-terminal-related transcriptional regulator [Adlercreutzia equolifaciens]